MSYISDMQAFYPKSWRQRIAINQYNGFEEWEGKKPVTVTVHQTTLRYGGPEEGGWWFTQGEPEKTYCIFDKKQAIKTFIKVCEEYKVWEQPSLGLSTTDYNWEVSFASTAAKHYPAERPYYC